MLSRLQHFDVDGILRKLLQTVTNALQVQIVKAELVCMVQDAILKSGNRRLQVEHLQRLSMPIALPRKAQLAHGVLTDSQLLVAFLITD